MAIYKMQLEDFEAVEYQLIAIHTSLEDYRVAYFLNQNLGIILEKDKNKIAIKSKFGENFYSKFIYTNQEYDIVWNLVQNKNEMITINRRQTQDLFFENELLTETKVFLLPEFKNVDFILKIDNTNHDFDLKHVVNTINKIAGVTTTYEIEQNNIKSKNNLIF